MYSTMAFGRGLSLTKTLYDIARSLNELCEAPSVHQSAVSFIASTTKDLG